MLEWSFPSYEFPKIMVSPPDLVLPITKKSGQMKIGKIWLGKPNLGKTCLEKTHIM